MKNAIIIVIFLFVMKPILPVLEYVLNYDYIVKELCENKAKPETNCNGKCHLMKELAKASENDIPASQDKKSSQTAFEVLFIQKLISLEVVTLNFPIQKAINAMYSDCYFYENNKTAFHPPTA